LSFDKSEIGNTGLTLFFSQMKLDLISSKKQEIFDFCIKIFCMFGAQDKIS
jgi:hypothetical protein